MWVGQSRLSFVPPLLLDPAPNVFGTPDRYPLRELHGLREGLCLDAQLKTLFALSNLWMVRKALVLDGQVRPQSA